MAVIQSRIELEKAKFVGGDTIRGQFSLAVDAVTKCRKVWLKIGWHTSGKGDKDEDFVVKKIVHEGDIPVGGLADSFEVVLPDGPASHRGHYINVNWVVQLHVDIPWGFDFKDSESFVLDAREAMPPE